MKRIFTLLLAGCLIGNLLCIPAFGLSAPQLISQTAVLMDLDSGQILFEKDMDAQKWPASITKIVTVYLSVIKGNPQDLITVKPSSYIQDPAATHIALVEQEEVTLRDMQCAAMLMSANDACNVIAEHISGSQEAFAEEMNAFAKSVGANNTHFSNAHGLPEDTHYTTAYDMALMLQKAMEEPRFREIFATTTYEMPANNLKPKRPFATQDDMMKSNNPSFYEGILGGKLGWTEEARHTKVTVAEREGRSLLVVVMDSGSKMDKYKDTAALLDYGFEQFIPYTITPQSVAAHTAKVMDGVNHVGDLDIYLASPQQILLHRAISPIDITFSAERMDSLTTQEAETALFPLRIQLPEEAVGLMYPSLPEIHLDTKLTPVMSKVEEVSAKDQLVWLAGETGRVIGKTLLITGSVIGSLLTILLIRKYWILFRRHQRKMRIQRKKQQALAATRRAQREAQQTASSRRVPPAPPNPRRMPPTPTPSNHPSSKGKPTPPQRGRRPS